VFRLSEPTTILVIFMKMKPHEKYDGTIPGFMKQLHNLMAQLHKIRTNLTLRITLEQVQ
jgi:hypothetical protein